MFDELKHAAANAIAAAAMPTSIAGAREPIPRHRLDLLPWSTKSW